MWIFVEESLQKYSHKTSQNNSLYTVRIYFLKLVESGKLLSYYYCRFRSWTSQKMQKGQKLLLSVALGLSLKTFKSYLKDHEHFYTC